jgi:16S rRNA processing protein RimM
VEKAAQQQDFIRLSLTGFNTRELGDTLKNLFILIPAKERVKLPEGRYYYYELVGCEVYTDELLRGKVKAVENYGGDDLLLIQLKDNREIFLPLRKEFVQSVDTVNKRIVSDKIDSFLEE